MTKKVADLSELFAFTGEISEQQVREFAKSYLDTLIKQLTHLENAINGQNWSEACSIAHSVKSNALYIAAKPLSESCANIEQLLKSSATINDNIQTFNFQWQATKAEFLAVIYFLQTYLG
jgi:HPt (histidine-containing phosphotransfer) domain-containing protein